MQGQVAIREPLQAVRQTFDVIRDNGQRSEYLEGVMNGLLWVLGEQDGDPIHRHLDFN